MKPETIFILTASLLVQVFSLNSQSVTWLTGGKLPGHPRILLMESEEQEIKRSIARIPQYGLVHNEIIHESDRILSEEPVVYQLTGRRLLSVARECRRRIFFLSYSWRLTGESAYLDRAERELLAIALFPDWNPSHFLDVAEFTMAAALGYDWLHESLSQTSRKQISTAIIEKGLQPSLQKEYNSWLHVSHNWNQVCNAGMVLGALAVWDDSPVLSDLIIKRSLASIPKAMAAYEPDGAYPEGYGYWEYGTTFNVIMISVLEKLKYRIPFGEGFKNTGYYLLHMSGVSGVCFNYSDNRETESVHPAMFWFAGKNNDVSLLLHEKKVLEKGRNLHRVRELPFLLIWGAGLDLGKIAPPKNNMWVSSGNNDVAILRSGWSENETFVGFKAGSPSFNHGHMDVGSFVMEASGERWAVDLGPQDYHSLESAGLDIWRYGQESERWQVFRYTNYAHNTLTLDNALQHASGRSEIREVWSRQGFSGCVADLTAVYKPKADWVRRGIALLENKSVLIRDEVKLVKSGKVRWTLLTPATVVIHNNTRVELKLNGKRLFLHFHVPNGATVFARTADPPSAHDALNPGIQMVGFEVTLHANTETYFNVLMTTDTKAKMKTTPPLEKWPLWKRH